MLEREGALDDPSNTGGSLCVADDRLDGANIERSVILRRFETNRRAEKGSTDGLSFNWIARRCA
jgi:hypothetical protein